MATARQLLDIALAQLGTKESPAGSNNVKYNTAYYGREVYDGLWETTFPWCVVFLWWCFREAGASALFYGGDKTASCGTLLGYYRARGQTVTDGDYQPGDLLFYNFTGGSDPEHVGLCESFGGATVMSIEGNTGIGNDANGGAVMRRSRTLGQIVGAARPLYEMEDTMDNTPSPAHKEGVEWAVKQGILQGNAEGDLMLSQPVTREQMCTMLYRFWKLIDR